MNYNILHIYKQVTDAVSSVTRIRADIAVSTAADIPNDDTLLTDSACYVRQEGKWYVKDEGGTWYGTDGNAAS